MFVIFFIYQSIESITLGDPSSSKSFNSVHFELDSNINYLTKRKLKSYEAMSSGLHTANLSWQTRVGKLRKVVQFFPSHVKLTLVKSQCTVIRNMADSVSDLLVPRHSRIENWNGKRRKEETESGGEIEFDNTSLCASSSVFFFCFFVFSVVAGYRCGVKRSMQPDNCKPLR